MRASLSEYILLGVYSFCVCCSIFTAFRFGMIIIRLGEWLDEQEKNKPPKS